MKEGKTGRDGDSDFCRAMDGRKEKADYFISGGSQEGQMASVTSIQNIAGEGF